MNLRLDVYNASFLIIIFRTKYNYTSGIGTTLMDMAWYLLCIFLGIYYIQVSVVYSLEVSRMSYGKQQTDYFIVSHGTPAD